MPRDDYKFLARLYDPLLASSNRGLIGVSMKMLDLTPGSRIVDLCCGTGEAVIAYAKAGYEAVGVDGSPSMLAVARPKIDTAATLIHGDAARTGFEAASFDAVTISMALHEMAPPDRDDVVVEIARILRPTGHLLAIDYDPDPVIGLKGRIGRAMTFAVERAVGGEHYAGYRHFMAHGGLPALLTRHGFHLHRRKRLTGGNLSAILFKPPGVAS